MELSQIDPKVIVDDCHGLVVGEHLKTGGQKRVWRCAFKSRAYVLKALLLDEETRRRVKREIQVMRVCSSAYLPKFGPIPLRELRVEPGMEILYFLEEYIDGVPLHSVYKPMPPQDVVHLGLCISDALAALADKKYLHRDVKPMNIMQKTPADYILIDAGLALDPDEDAITVPGKVVGTRAYLSPDQITLPQKDLDIRSDLFCLGIVLYECGTGKHPFWNDETPKGEIVHNILNFECVSPLHFNPSLPEELSSVILALLRKNREERYRGHKNLASDLSKLMRKLKEVSSPKRAADRQPSLNSRQKEKAPRRLSKRGIQG
jgi:serine/threonine protein kinase